MKGSFKNENQNKIAVVTFDSDNNGTSVFCVLFKTTSLNVFYVNKKASPRGRGLKASFTKVAKGLPLFAVVDVDDKNVIQLFYIP